MTAHRHRGRPGHRRPDLARPDRRRARSRSSPPATPRSSRRWPASGCRSRATRSRRWSRSCSSRSTRSSSCRTRSTSTSARRTRASSSSAPASTATTATRQRGAFHIIEHQMAAAARALPDLRARARAADLGRHRGRLAGRLADHRADAGRRAVPRLRLGDRRVQGDAGVGLGAGPHGRPRRAARAQPRRSRWSGSRPARSSTSTAPRRSPTDAARSPARGAGRATRPSSATAARRHRLPGRPRRADDAEWAEYLFMRDNPKGAVARALGPHGRLPALVRPAPATR